MTGHFPSAFRGEKRYNQTLIRVLIFPGSWEIDQIVVVMWYSSTRLCVGSAWFFIPICGPRNYTLRQLSLNYCGIGEDGVAIMGSVMGCVSHESRTCVTLGMTRAEEWTIDPVMITWNHSCCFLGFVYLPNRLLKYDFVTYRRLGWCIDIYIYIFFDIFILKFLFTYTYIYTLNRYTIR